MVDLSNTQVQGRYIFSGDQDQTPAYQINTGTDPIGNGVTQLATSASTRQVEDPEGGAFPVSDDRVADIRYSKCRRHVRCR